MEYKIRRLTYIYSNKRILLCIIYEYLYAYFFENEKIKIYGDQIKKYLLEKQSYVCNICNKKIDIYDSELDHIVLVGDKFKNVFNSKIIKNKCEHNLDVYIYFFIIN